MKGMITKKRAKKVKKGNIINFPLQNSIKIRDNDIAFEMTVVASITAMERNPSRAHRHSYFEILYVEEADGRHTIDHTVFDDIKDRVFLICPGQVHSWENVGNIRAVQIDFNEEFLVNSTFSVNAVWELNLLREMGGCGVPVRERDKNQVDETVRLMFKEYKRKSHEYASVIRSYINIFLILVFRIYRCESPGYWPRQRRSPLLENFQKLVIDHVEERKTVKFYADKLGISMGYLNEQAKSSLGVSPSIFIKKAAVTEAKRLIANTDMSMTEIALKLGFSNGSYFCRLFKTEMGVTPTQFKRTCIRKAKRE